LAPLSRDLEQYLPRPLVLNFGRLPFALFRHLIALSCRFHRPAPAVSGASL